MSWQAKRGNLLLEDEKPVIASEEWQSRFKVTQSLDHFAFARDDDKGQQLAILEPWAPADKIKKFISKPRLKNLFFLSEHHYIFWKKDQGTHLTVFSLNYLILYHNNLL